MCGLIISISLVGASLAAKPISAAASGAGTSGTGTWSAPRLIDRNELLASVSCPSASFCVAVDGSGGNAITYNGKSWSAPKRIDTGTGQAVMSVSCPTASFCVAVDNLGRAITYNGKSWSAPKDIDTVQFPELLSVSCPTASFCVAIDGEENAITYNGKSWSAPKPIGGTKWSWSFSVSCPTASFCVAVDNGGRAITYNGTSWSAPKRIDPTISFHYEMLNSVSCPTASFCVAVDEAGDAITYNGKRWSAPKLIDSYESAYGAFSPSWVSCPTASFCVAVDYSGRAITYNGKRWSAPKRIDSSREVGGTLVSVSCPSPMFCTAAQYPGYALTYMAPYAVWSNILYAGYVQCGGSTILPAVYLPYCPDSGKYTAIEATITVPAFTKSLLGTIFCPGSTRFSKPPCSTSSAWVGIGGVPGDAHDLVQAGFFENLTSTGLVSTTPSYDAFYETLPNGPTHVVGKIVPGDQIQIIVEEVKGIPGGSLPASGTWHVSMKNLTTGEVFFIKNFYDIPNFTYGHSVNNAADVVLEDTNNGRPLSQTKAFQFRDVRFATSSPSTDPVWHPFFNIPAGAILYNMNMCNAPPGTVWPPAWAAASNPDSSHLGFSVSDTANGTCPS
jgi:hypothetical protein